MTERKQTRVFCSKAKRAHEIGAVYATTSGPVFRFTEAINTPTGATTRQAAINLADPVAAGVYEAFCAPCSMRLPVLTDRLVGRSVTLTAEGTWRDPLGVIERKRRTDLG